MRSLVLLLALALVAPAHGAARLFLGNGADADDAVRRGILSADPLPDTIFAVRQRLKALGGTLQTHIVGNRGHDNPEAGSFSFFESYTGSFPGGHAVEADLFLGFFTERRGDTLSVLQGFEPGLMIELIAWDFSKQLYNFWELVGNGTGSEWHYRGNSTDILADLANINVGHPTPAFGKRLRCSGCHSLGGPVMKEFSAPHNDWWTSKRKLDLGTMKLEPGSDPMNHAHVAADLFAHASDAANLSRLVKIGTDRLVAARSARGGDGQNLKQLLRPLFTTVEMNLVSDSLPFAERKDSAIAVPQDFFVDARLTGDRKEITVAPGLYRDALQRAGTRFAPDEVQGLTETHHAFLVPARANIDDRTVDALMKSGLLDETLVMAVLSVDYTTPVFSAARSSLLAFVPESAKTAAELKASLIQNLRKATHAPAAKELLANLTDPARTVEFFRKQARDYRDRLAAVSQDPAVVFDWLRLASQRRKELAEAETSRNPRGQILEPGFRVIFPVDDLKPESGRLRLDPETGRATTETQRARSRTENEQ